MPSEPSLSWKRWADWVNVDRICDVIWRPCKKDKRRLSGRRVKLKLLRRFQGLLTRPARRFLRYERLRLARLLRSRCRRMRMWRIFLVVGVEMYFWIFLHQSSFEWKFPRNRYLLTVISLCLYLVFLFLFPLSLYFLSCDGLVYHIKSPLFCLLYAHISPFHSVISLTHFRSHFYFIFLNHESNGNRRNSRGSSPYTFYFLGLIRYWSINHSEASTSLRRQSQPSGHRVHAYRDLCRRWPCSTRKNHSGSQLSAWWSQLRLRWIHRHARCGNRSSDIEWSQNLRHWDSCQLGISRATK